MNKLTYKELPLGGFAGLKEKQFVKDERVFNSNTKGLATNGIGNFVYLADANFQPFGETGMHPHKELDVISVMAEGEIAHAGSLENGNQISSGEAQVQRAGSIGFSHNEVNPNATPNQLIQIWVLPEQRGKQENYFEYKPRKNQLTKIYGGSSQQTDTLDSRTTIHLVNTDQTYTQQVSKPTIIYISKGKIELNGETIHARTLVHLSESTYINALEHSQIILISAD